MFGMLTFSRYAECWASHSALNQREGSVAFFGSGLSGLGIFNEKNI